VTGQDSREREMTVARVRTAGVDFEVMFFESARIYRLPRASPAFEETLRELRAAAASGARVRVLLTAPRSEAIESAQLVR
jgi:hypothetical protein